MINVNEIEGIRQTLKELNQEETEGKEKIDKEAMETRFLWQAEIAKLQEKQQNDEYKYEEQDRILKNKMAKKRKPLCDRMNEAMWIFSHIEIYDKDLDNTPTKWKIYGVPDYTLADDKFKRVGVYIWGNGKPVNKFTIQIMHQSFFSWKFTNLRYSKDLH